jgi:hypothetical protein
MLVDAILQGEGLPLCRVLSCGCIVRAFDQEDALLGTGQVCSTQTPPAADTGDSRRARATRSLTVLQRLPLKTADQPQRQADDEWLRMGRPCVILSLGTACVLHGFRWNSEFDVRSIEQSLGLEHLSCLSPATIRIELRTAILAHNRSARPRRSLPRFTQERREASVSPGRVKRWIPPGSSPFATPAATSGGAANSSGAC